MREAWSWMKDIPFSRIVAQRPSPRGRQTVWRSFEMFTSGLMMRMVDAPARTATSMCATFPVDPSM
jgi:hypothetical protein